MNLLERDSRLVPLYRMPTPGESELARNDSVEQPRLKSGAEAAGGRRVYAA